MLYILNNKKPNWDEILNNADDFYYYFAIGEVPSSIDKNNIKEINYDDFLKNISNPLDVRKIDYKTKPVFAIVFAKCDNLSEIQNILKLNMTDFIVQEKH